MRGLLSSMMSQIDKVEKFKYTQLTGDSLHAKYGVVSGLSVVGDCEWGHLQLDATSLYLLILAEMTASGTKLTRNLGSNSFFKCFCWYHLL